MKKLCKAAAFIITLCMLLSTIAPAYAAADSTDLTAESLQLSDNGIDAAELAAAVLQNDTDKLVDMLMKWLGDYYRQNGLKDDFGYFNADVYLSTYQDVNTACNGDKQKALEHYIATGAKEGRISGGKYDLPLAVRIDPSFLLNPDILNVMGDPAAFLKAAEKPVEQLTKGNKIIQGSSGDGYTPTQGPGSYTLIAYGSGDGYNIMDEFLTGVLALYKTENINMIFALGGSYTWNNEYFNNLLGGIKRSDDDPEKEPNKTGFFTVNVSELNSVLDKLSEETGIPVSSMVKVISQNTKIANELRAEIISAVYSENVLPLVEGTSVSTDAPLGSPKTLETLIELAKTNCTADTYALTFTGHGGGPTGCLFSSDGSPSVDSRMIDAALESAEFGEQNRMSMISFDSCSMGCVETAAVLGKYCEYMYASEASQEGGLDMNIWINAVKNNLNSTDLSKAVAYAVYESRVDSDYGICTSAISDSTHARELLDAIDQWSGDMLAAMTGSDADTAKKYFHALKKASVYCYQITPDTENSFDIKDFMQEIKTFLNEQGINAMDAKTNAVITAADALSEQNAFIRYFKILYDSNAGGVIENNAEYREEHYKYDFCGFSILFPDYKFTRLYESLWDKAKIQQSIDSQRKYLTKEYISKYENLGLKRYTELINEYLDYYFTAAEAERIRNLSNEMASCSSESGVVAGYKDIASVSWNEDNTFVQVNIKDYPEGLALSESSSGDVLIDITDTAKEFCAYLTSKLEVTGKDGTSKNIDMVFVNDIENCKISEENMKGYQSRIEMEPKYFLDNDKMTISYADKDGVAWGDTDYLDILIEAQDSESNSRKKEILIAGVSEFKDLADKLEAAKKEYEDNPDDDEKSAAYETVKAELDDFYDSCTLYSGECTASGVKTGQVYLIMKKDQSGNLIYLDAAVKSNSEDTFEHVENVENIRFYHYEFSDVISEDQDTGTDRLTPIETRSDYNGSYYDDAKYTYDVTDENNPVIIKKIGLSKFLHLSEGENDSDKLGYYITLIKPDDQIVVLNSRIDGQNVALSDENYATPLTRGQLEEILDAFEQTEEPDEAEGPAEPEELKQVPISESEVSINDAVRETQAEQPEKNEQSEINGEPLSTVPEIETAA